MLTRVSLEAGEPGKGNEAALRAVFPFSSGETSYDLAIDSTALRAVAGGIQGIYADNGSNAQQLIITISQTQQRIIVPPYAQGFYPVLNLKGIQTNVNVTSSGGVDSSIYFLNVPTIANSWSTLAASSPSGINVTIAAVTGGSFTDRSGTVTTGGSYNQLIAANASRKRLYIENPTAESEVLYIAFGGAGSTGHSVELVPGGFLDTALGPCTLQSIYVSAATNAHKVIAWEM